MDLLRKKAARVHEYYKETKQLSNIDILKALGLRHAYGYTSTPFNTDEKEARPPLSDLMCIAIIHSHIEDIHV
jgi:hypothetical protein